MPTGRQLDCLHSNRVLEPSCFFWPVVDIGNHGGQISNSHKSNGGACPRGMGRGEGSTEQCAVFKSQDDMPLWPECANSAGLYLLGIYL